MSFAALSVAVTDLRVSLRSFVGPAALSEITIRPPVAGEGEISFVRLVAWSYVLVFEAGRVSIPYLLRTSGSYEQSREGMDLVHALRTWSFHNLGFASGRDRALSRHVHQWFLDACGRSPPADHAAWNTCFDRLCNVVSEVVERCQRAVEEVVSMGDDGTAVMKDLQRRLERLWPPREFDALIGDLALRLGITVDVVKFRAPRLDGWRNFLLNMAEDDDPAEAVGRLIERDLLEYEDGLLPISGVDVMRHFGMLPGPEVGTMLRHARELARQGVREKEELLERLGAWRVRRSHDPQGLGT